MLPKKRAQCFVQPCGGEWPLQVVIGASYRRHLLITDEIDASRASPRLETEDGEWVAQARGWANAAHPPSPASFAPHLTPYPSALARPGKNRLVL